MTQNFKVIQKHSPRNPKKSSKNPYHHHEKHSMEICLRKCASTQPFSDVRCHPQDVQAPFLFSCIFMSFYIFPSVTLHMEHHCCSTPKFFPTLVARMKRPVKVGISACQYFFNYYTPLAGPTSCVSLQVFPEVVLPSEYFPTEVAGEDGFGRAKAVSLLCVLLPPSPVAKLFPARGTDRPLLSGLLHHKSVSVQVPVV